MLADEGAVDDGVGNFGVERGHELEEERIGALLNRAWPVRFRREMSFLNLETVTSVRSEQSTRLGLWLRRRIRFSMPFNPSDAAS